MCRNLIQRLESIIINSEIDRDSLEEVPDEAIRYGILSQKNSPSQEEEEEIIGILKISTENESLLFWIEQIDHIISHAEGDLDENSRQSYKDQASVLREHFDPNACNTQIYYSSVESTYEEENGVGITKNLASPKEPKTQTLETCPD